MGFRRMILFFPGRLLFCACKKKSKIFVVTLSRQNKFRIYIFTLSLCVSEIRCVTEGRTDTMIYMCVCGVGIRIYMCVCVV